ncbi:MAG: DNA-3-methyladenine glycosylase I [Nitrospirae bacterium]|nr:DNA-3-methyladenine glycosylase I [Nitrospirota bacterium]
MIKKQGIELTRCPWVDLSKPDYVEYHDKEWGVPIHDDRTIFEFLTLEAAQAGLSWYTVLRKRDHYRRIYRGFDPEEVAQFRTSDIKRMIQDPGIIRNSLKIEASVNNARRFLEVQKEHGSFSNYIWAFVNNKPKVHTIKKLTDYAATSDESDALSRDLKKRGFKFMGSTICYAHMQATGMVNDHSTDCFRRSEIIKGYASCAVQPR